MKDTFKIGLMVGMMLVLVLVGYAIGFNKGVLESGKITLPALESMKDEVVNLTERYYDCRDDVAEYKYANEYWQHRYEDLLASS